MSARFGGSPDLSSFWALNRDGRDAFRVVPRDRFDIDLIYDPNRRAVDKSYARHGAFLDDIRSFPALALGIPPRRVEVMDPQHRLALELAIDAIHDAGALPADLPRNTGVFMGATSYEFRALLSLRALAVPLATGDFGHVEDPDAILAAVNRIVPSRPYAAPGVLGNMIGATVAQELDLHGPAYTVDSACASALLALSDAVALLRARKLDAAIAGGVYLCMGPELYVGFCRVGAMSQQGKCLPFDTRADGFVLGEGGGAVILKRLEDAQRDGDRIYAVVHGVATNNDGRGDGPMAPRHEGQGDVVAAAWREAGLDLGEVGYIETHGTGTEIGDLTELEGLRRAFGEHAVDVALGSSKANIGHTNSAAGIAGLIRTALAIHHRVIPPMCNFEIPKEHLHLAAPWRVPTAAEPWGERMLAGVSSFGFGGTNAHIALAPPPSRAVPRLPVGAPLADPHELVLLSAGDEAAVRDLAGRLAVAIRDDDHATLPGVSRAMATRGWRFSARAGIVAANLGELLTKLDAVARGEQPAGVQIGTATRTPRIAFLYPGQGAQRVGMLARLRERYPLVGEAVAEVDRAVEGELVSGIDELLWPERRAVSVSAERAAAELTATEHCQPAMFAAGIALTRLLDAAGVRPAVVTGHSLGEFVAAAVGGAVRLGDGARFIARRGRAMAALPGEPGAMVALMTDVAGAAPLLVDGAVIANKNHPRQVVVSGATAAVAEVARRAEAAGVKAVPLEVSHAFHSPMLAALDSEGILGDTGLATPTTPVASAISGALYGDAADVRGVFLRHATSPVDFVGALAACEAAGADLYLQVGAGGPLASFCRGALPGRRVLTLASIDDAAGVPTFLEALASLWVEGVDVDPRPLTAPGALPVVPPIVFPRESYWPVTAESHLVPKIPGRVAKPRVERVVAPAAVAVVAVAAGASAEVDPVLERVLAVVAKVSAYPLAALRVESKLRDDLGFDSLMVGDLATQLAEAFPGLGGIPQELLLNQPTVGDIVGFARGGPRADAGASDDAPLRAFAPVWVARALPRSRRAAVSGRVRTVGASAAERAALAAAGLTVVDDGPADLLVAFDPALPELIAVFAALDRAGDSLDVLVASGDAGVHGATRALAREWPGAVVKAVDADGDRVVRLLEEARSIDRTPSVRWRGDRREVPGLAPAGAVDAAPIGPNDVVVVTGGTRGIGARLAVRLAATGAALVLVGRGEPDAVAAPLVAAGARHIRADVTDVAALAGLAGATVLVHAAGTLADGPVGKVDEAEGRGALAVKLGGWDAAVAACGPSLRLGLAIGSWAGRFGNRHQVWYSAANAALAERCATSPFRAVCAEFGPWSSSEMVRSIPAPVQQAMRSEGVDFVGDEAGLDALLDDLARRSGVVVHGRDLPPVLAEIELEETLSVETHPFLLDHAIDGHPIWPLASATDLIARASGVSAPFEITDLRLYQGVVVDAPVRLVVTVRNDRAEIRQGDRRTLAYRARIRPLETVNAPADPGELRGGAAPTVALAEFYGGITFHGKLLQGLVSIDGMGEGFARGEVRTGAPSAWIPADPPPAWAVDPLVFDSAMQLSGYVAWTTLKRAGTPIGFRRFVQLRPWPSGVVIAEVRYAPGAGDGDKFTGDLVIRDAAGPIAIALDVAAELRAAPAEEAMPSFDKKWVDPGQWKEVADLEARRAMAAMAGIRNPYFTVHQGTARNRTHVDGRELINFSSYNYLGFSGDPRVLSAVTGAVARYGTSVSASRVASGQRPFHVALEQELAAAQGAEDALVFTAGHAVNVTVIGHLFGARDIVFHDELIHDSSLQGIKLAGAQRRAFRHDDLAHLEEQLRALRGGFEKALIVIEGVYSMDGDVIDVHGYLRLKEKYGCLLLVDEAHSFGVIGKTGQGLREHCGIKGSEVDLWMGTLSKSLSSCGGWIAGSHRLIEYLRYTAPGFVYSAGLTPANGVAALTSLRLMLAEPERVDKLQANARRFHDQLVGRGIDTGPARGGSAVIPAVTGNSMHALLLSQRCVDAGINVQPIVYPAVADDAARLRFFLSSTHTFDELDHAAETVARLLADVRREFPG